MNLTTAVHSLAFSADGAMLALASHDAKNALRVAHMDSCTVFENWPTQVSRVHLRMMMRGCACKVICNRALKQHAAACLNGQLAIGYMKRSKHESHSGRSC